MLNVKCCVLEFWGAALKAGYNKPGSQLGQILHALWGEKISGYLTQNWLLCQILWDMAIGRGAHLHPHTTGLNYCMNVPGKLKITCHNEFALLFSPFSQPSQVGLAEVVLKSTPAPVLWPQNHPQFARKCFSLPNDNNYTLRQTCSVLSCLQILKVCMYNYCMRFCRCVHIIFL